MGHSKEHKGAQAYLKINSCVMKHNHDCNAHIYIRSSVGGANCI